MEVYINKDKMKLQEQLSIRNFGPLSEINMEEITSYLFLIGESGTGKSTILKVLAIMRHIYKQMGLRSYLKEGNISESSIVFSFNEYLRNGGMEKYVKDNTEICYSRGDCKLTYTKSGGLQGTKKVLGETELSLEKISFLSDKRGSIPAVLANSGSGKSLGFYFEETFRDFKTANEMIKTMDLPFLGINFHEEKAGNGSRKFIIKNYIKQDGKDYEVNFEDASSGMQTLTPLTLITEYYTRHYDIVKDTNHAILTLLAQNDSLSSFKHDMNIGEISQRNIHFFIEEPELSLFPAAQCSLINLLVSQCQSSENNITLSVATHSPYIINHLNLLMKAHDKKVTIEDASLSYDNLSIYKIEKGNLIDLKVKNAHLINTDLLSDQIDSIYNLYDEIDRMEP